MFTFLASVIVLGIISLVALKLISKRLAGGKKADKKEEGEHHPFTVLGYQVSFLLTLVVVQVGIWYGLPGLGLRLELRKGVMLAAYIGQLAAWNSVVGWLYEIFGQKYNPVHPPSDGGDDYLDTIEGIVLWGGGILLAIIVMAGFQWSDNELDWTRLFARAYFAPGITVWLLVGAHYPRIPKIWESGVAAVLIGLMVFPLAEYLRGCEPWGNLLAYGWWFPNVF